MKWTIPVNPVPASRPRVGRWGSYYTGPYVVFRDSVQPVLREMFKGWVPLDYCMSVTVGIHPKKPKTSKLKYPKPDVDNYAKAVLDSCNELVWVDDSLIIELEVNKSWSKSDGYFTLTIKEY